MNFKMYCKNTEILTREGFKLISNINKNEKLLLKSRSNGLSFWSDCKGLIDENYNGDIYYLKTKYWESPRFTPDEKLWVTFIKQPKGSIDEMSKDCKKQQYTNIWRKHIVVDHKINLELPDNPDMIKIGNNDYEMKTLFYWLGMVATDGHLSKRDPVVIITQCKNRNISEISRVMDVLFEDRWTLNEYERDTNRIFYFNIYDKQMYKWALDKINRIKKERRLIKLFDDHPRLLNEFMIGALLGDGWYNVKSNSRGIFCGVSEDLAKDYQVIMSILGRRSNLTIKDQRGQISQIQSKKGIIEIISRNLMHRLSIHSEGASTARRNQHLSENYNDTVYSPITKSGLIFIRRKGMAFWSSSLMEKDAA